VNDVGFDAPGSKPARQPEAVAARLERDGDARDRAALLERDGDARDRAALLGGLRTPAHQQADQLDLTRFELLQRMALNAWDNAGDEPARLAHLDNCNDRAVLLQGSEGPAQIIELLCHGTLHRRCFQRRW
jgi:hypothetical protein